MPSPRIPTWGVIALLVASTAACSRGPKDAPPTLEMPETWSIVSDEAFAPSDIHPVADRLGGEVKGLRNTVYEVGGKQVKINTIVAVSSRDADAIMGSLGQMKPDEFLFRKGHVIYEFVGKDEAIPEMRGARALIAAR